ncbi:MAG: hypothetical protein KKF77_11230 [Proteobacteria bacterium]|nr:hypothetical protein [Pseudomonadota bacterium]
MKALTKSLALLALSLLLSAPLAGGALASNYYPNDINTLSTFLSGAAYTQYTGAPLTGAYDLTPLGFEAGDTIQFKSAVAGDVLFTNKNLAAEFAKGWKTADLGSAIFNDLTTTLKTSVNDLNRVAVLQLTQAWTLSSGLTLNAGTLILGLNDDGSKDGDFDDFILAAKAAPTPVPGAVWLLGSGLLGIMGFKRTRKALAVQS